MRSKRVVRNRTRIKKSLRGGMWPFKNKEQKERARIEKINREAGKKANKQCDDYCKKVFDGELPDCNSRGQAWLNLDESKYCNCEQRKGEKEPPCLDPCKDFCTEGQGEGPDLTCEEQAMHPCRKQCTGCKNSRGGGRFTRRRLRRNKRSRSRSSRRRTKRNSRR